MSSEMVDVLIVGAGPVGLLAAAELARHGLRPKLVERATQQSPYSKALGMHMRTMEILDGLGLLDEAKRRGHLVHAINAFSAGKRLFHLHLDIHESPTPYLLIIPQYETEHMLAAHAASLGVSVERGLTLSGLTQDADSVTASVTDAEGQTKTIQARWMIAADGAHSTTRQLLGIPYEGEDLGTQFVLADVTLSTELPHDEAFNCLSPDGLAMLLPLPAPNTWRVIADFPADTPRPEPTLELFQEILNTRLHVPATASDPKWLAGFTVRQRKAPSYRWGRVFLAGDAAHCHSPMGGQGMNTGLQDAFNLAWKLSLVVKGVAQESLLNSYDAEREPVAEALLKGTARGTKLMTLRGSLSQAVRNTLVSIATSFDAVQQKIIRTLGELDIHYRNSPIVAETRTSVLFAPLTASPDSEQASLLQWRDFSAAPHPGDRAPLPLPANPDDPTLSSLFGLFSHPGHTLLLFDGRASTAAGYQTLTDIADEISQMYAGQVRAHIVVPMSEKPEAIANWSGSVVLDADAKLHDAYGAGAECLYLIRPDGYVAYRAQPAERIPLLTFLHHHIFTALPLPPGVPPAENATFSLLPPNIQPI